MASPSTVAADLDIQAGKGWSYARAGVAEYLVLDPPGEMLPELGRGWRLADGRYEPWHPDHAARWQSAAIGAAIGVEGGLAAVYDRSGRRVLRSGEVLAALDAREREGLARGLDEGRLKGTREAVRQLAHARFGMVASLDARIAGATADDLDWLLVRLVTVSSAGEL